MEYKFNPDLDGFMPKGPILNITHKTCFDGLVSAWLVKNYVESKGLEYEVMFSNYSDTPPSAEEVAGKRVYLTDFSYPGEVLLELCKSAKSVTVIDHHESAIKKLDAFFTDQHLPSNLTLHFDLKHSGAGLTWSLMYPKEPMSPLVTHAQDHDLWLFKHPDTKAFMAYFGMLGLTFEAVDELNADPDKAVVFGELLLRKEAEMVAWHMSQVTYFVTDYGVTLPIVNAPRYIANKVADLLTVDYPFVTMYEDYPKHRKLSFRASDTGLNVSLLADLVGGGGNSKAAAAAMSKYIPVEELLERDDVRRLVLNSIAETNQ